MHIINNGSFEKMYKIHFSLEYESMTSILALHKFQNL